MLSRGAEGGGGEGAHSTFGEISVSAVVNLTGNSVAHMRAFSLCE